MLISAIMLLAIGLAPPEKAEKTQNAPAADVITFKDGKELAGMVLEPAPRGKLGFVVRRDLARRSLPDHYAKWEKDERKSVKLAQRDLLDRLNAWKSDRSGKSGLDAKLSTWIDQRIGELGKSDGSAETPLMLLSVDRTEPKKVTRRAQKSARLLRLAWLAGLDSPESQPASALAGALEAKGVGVEGTDPAPLASLLPPARETDEQWLVRRASTELKFESGGRFVKNGPVLLPDVQPGAAVGMDQIQAGIATLKSLIDPESNEDPLRKELGKLEAQGRVGAIVTDMSMAPDFSETTVTAVMFVKNPQGRWIPAGKRSSTVKASDLPKQNAEALENDPTIRQAFGLAESLGFGKLDPNIKQQALSVGATVQQALAKVRGDVASDLEQLAIPIKPAR